MLTFRRVAIACFLVISLSIIPQITGVSRRCYSCNSRGPYGDCRDVFSANPNNLDKYPGVTLEVCSTGWCGKVVNNDNEELSVSTERLCLPRPPDDNLERCAEVQVDRRTVYMCFCMGDLCNGASFSSPAVALLLVIASLTAYLNLR